MNLLLPATDALLHGLPQRLGPHRLEEEGDDLVLKGPVQVGKGVVGRDDHDLGAEPFTAQFLQGQHSVPAGKVDVQQHDVRRTFPGKSLELRDASRLLYLEPREKAVKQHDQGIALQLLVLDDERPQRRNVREFGLEQRGLRDHGRFTGLSGRRSSTRVPPQGTLRTSRDADFP